MSTLNGTDQLLVQRNGQHYYATPSQMSELLDTDLMLVQRDGVHYYITGADIKSLGGPVTGSVDITPLAIAPSFDPQFLDVETGIVEVNGSIPADVTFTWYRYDSAAGDTGRTQIRTVTKRDSSDSVELPSDAAEKYIGCDVTFLNIVTPETQRCSVEAWPALELADVEFILIAGGGTSYGAASQSRSGGGAGGYVTSAVVHAARRTTAAV